MLNREEIKKMITTQDLIANYSNLDIQLTPNGFDLTVESVFEFDASGSLDFSNKERLVPKGKKIIPEKKNQQDKFGWWNLGKGAYKIRTNEFISLPDNLIGIAYSRTSLLRMGAFTQNGVWDAGFRGKSEFILVVENNHGIKLKQNARIVQIVFLPINKTGRGYQGIYQE